MVGIDDPYVAYCFDEAIDIWGNHVEAEIEEAQEGAKDKKQARQKVLMRLKILMSDEFGEESETPAPVSSGQFRDPAQMMS